MIVLNKYPSGRILYINDDGILMFKVHDTNYPCILEETNTDYFNNKPNKQLHLKDIMKNVYSKRTSDSIRDMKKSYNILCKEQFAELTYAQIVYRIYDEEIIIEFLDWNVELELFSQYAYRLFKQPNSVNLSSTERFLISLSKSKNNKSVPQQQYELIVKSLLNQYHLTVDKKTVSYKDSVMCLYWVNKIMGEIKHTFKVKGIHFTHHKSLNVVLSNNVTTRKAAHYQNGTICIYVKQCKTFEIFRQAYIHEYGHHLDSVSKSFFRKKGYRDKLIQKFLQDENVKRVIVGNALLQYYLNSDTSKDNKIVEAELIAELSTFNTSTEFYNSHLYKLLNERGKYLIDDRELFARCFECIFPMSLSEVKFEERTVHFLVHYLKTFAEEYVK